MLTDLQEPWLPHPLAILAHLDGDTLTGDIRGREGLTVRTSYITVCCL